VSHHRDDASHDPGELGEPATEQYVGRRDLTHWSRPVRAFVGLILRIFRNTPALHVLLATTAVGAGIALLLTWAAEEIYDSVKAADGLSSLDEPVLELAISLRTPQTVAVAQFITNLGGTIGLTIITVVIVMVMTLMWRSRTPVLLLAIGTAGSLLMTAVGKELVGRSRPPVGQQHGGRLLARLPSPAAPHIAAVANRVDGSSGGLVRHDRPHPRLPRLPLADRRHGGLAARPCLDGDGDHLPPPLPDGPTSRQQRNPTRHPLARPESSDPTDSRCGWSQHWNATQAEGMKPPGVSGDLRA